MKKLATLLLAAGMVVASSAPASAADIKVGGFHMFTFESGSYGFKGANQEDVLQRTRLNLTIAASENLKGFIEFQMGSDSWGDYAGKHSAAGASEAALGDKHGRYNVQTRQAYVDWTVPGTNVKVRMGRSCFGLPAEAFGRNSVMDASWGGRDGIIVTAPVADWLSVTAFWNRAGYADGPAKNDVDTDHNSDVYGLAAALKFNGFSVTPYAAYANLDAAANGVGVKTVGDGPIYLGDTGLVAAYPTGNAYWVGATATLSAFDPFTLKVSAVYGNAESKGAGSSYDEERDGWNVQAKASYKLGFGTPVLGAWYGSGDDDDVKYGRQGWMPSVNGRFGAAMSFHDAAYGLGGGVGTNNIAGTWGVQAGIENISFLTDLTQAVKVTYIAGTNDEKAFGAKAQDAITAKAISGPQDYMTTEDSVIELSLDNTYKIYKNLIANLELAYLINDFDEQIWGKTYDEDDWRVALTLEV